MTFQKLADFFSQLDQTTKRLELIEILSRLFSEIEEPEEARQVSYLLQGRVVAFYEPIEFGMAERLIERALALGAGKELKEVQDLNKKLGDLGKVAEELVTTENGKGKRLAIEDVYKALKMVTEEKGEGSIERKVEILSTMVAQMDALSAKYVVRIVSGTLRLGIGDVTILEALGHAQLGDRKHRAQLEKIYNEISDLGEIAAVIFEEGTVESRLEAVCKLQISVGRPLRSELCERLPNAEKTIEKMGKVAVQFKYDGFRTQMHLDRKSKMVRLFSRNLEETTHAFPELITGLLDQVDADSVILDSEAIAYHTESDEFLPFQETTKRRRKHDVDDMAEKLPLKAFVFDILYKNGVSLLDKPVTERLEILGKTIKGATTSELKTASSEEIEARKKSTLIVSETRIVERSDELQLMLDEALTRGLEGLVIKKVDSPYEAGARNFNWVKLKHTASSHMKDTIDCVIIGYILGRGKRTEFGVGALLVGVYDKDRDEFVSISKIGTGLNDAEWVAVRERCDKLQSVLRPPRVVSEIVPSVWVEPEVVIEVLCDEITRSPLHTAGRTESEPGYALRFPRLITFRDKDKRAEDATTVAEIAELYKIQTNK